MIDSRWADLRSHLVGLGFSGHKNGSADYILEEIDQVVSRYIRTTEAIAVVTEMFMANVREYFAANSFNGFLAAIDPFKIPDQEIDQIQGTVSLDPDSLGDFQRELYDSHRLSIRQALKAARVEDLALLRDQNIYSILGNR